MSRKMLIDAAHPEETRVAVVDAQSIEEFDYETAARATVKGNIYLAKITRVEPSLQAAFVEYGGGRHGFLAFSEIHPDYYQIPAADREALIAAEKEAAALAREQEDDEVEGGRRRGRPSRGRAKGRNGKADAGGENAAEGAAKGASASNGGRRGRSRARSRAQDPSRGLALDDGLLTTAPLPPALLDALDRGLDAEGAWSSAVVAAPAPPPDAVAAAYEALEPEARAAAERALEESARDVDEEHDQVDADVAADEGAAAEQAAPTAQSEEPRRAVAEDAGDAFTDRAPTTQADDAASDPSAVDEPGARNQLDETLEGDDAATRPDDAETLASDEVGASDLGEGDLGDDQEDVDLRGDASEDAYEANGDELADAGVETLGAEDPAEEVVSDEVAREAALRRLQRLKDYKIQEVIKRRQIMLVQVDKEERGNKGAALTTYLSLAGRYCVLMPNTARGGGISRKITNAADRKRLKAVANEFEVPDGMGLIIRTAGSNRTTAELRRDYEYLLRQWAAIRELTLRSVAPALIYEEGSLIKRSIRDLYGKDVDTIIVDGDEGWREAREYIGMLMPTHVKNVERHDDAAPLFSKHGVEQQISAMLNPTVQLKSGGYIVIGVTEALVAIDVNSGRSTKEASIENTALKTNLEAADEIARQLRLRDLAGLIVIDFIDMEDGKNNRAVEKRLKDRLKSDRARIQVGRISVFGLLEMSRQRLRPGLLEATTSPCPHCRGAGVVRSDDATALAVLRALEDAAGKPRIAALRLSASIQVTNYLMNAKRRRIAELEIRRDIDVTVEADPGLTHADFKIEKIKAGHDDDRRPRTAAIQVEAGFDNAVEADDDEDGDASADAGAGRRGRRDGGEAARGDRRRDATEADGAETTSEPRAATEGARDEGDDTEDGRKRRGRRGGRRRRRGGAENGRGDEAGLDPMPVIDLDAPEFDGADGERDEIRGLGRNEAGDAVAVAERPARSRPTESDAGPVETAASPNEAVASAAEPSGRRLADLFPTQALSTASPNGAAARETVENGADVEQALESQIAEKSASEAGAEEAAAPEAPPKPRRSGWWSFRRNG